jgi:protein-S-isoprenylcysteine O-methyltransferase Ste14
MSRYIEQHIQFQKRTYSKWGRQALIVTFPVFFILFFLFAPGWWGSQRFPIPMGLGGTAGWYVGLPISGSGVALYLWTIVLFAKAQGTQVPVAPTQTIVTSGPYAVSRNPMVTSAIFMVCGAGLLFNSLSFILAGLVIPTSYLIYIKLVEESELEARFGEAYLSYKKSTPFIVPTMRFW